MKDNWAIRAPILGIAAAIFAVVSVIVGGTSTPDVDAPAREIISHYNDSAQVISAILGALAALFVIFFSATLHSRLRSAGSLANLSLVGGALFAFGIGIFAALSITLYDLASSDKAIDPGTLQAVNALNEDFFFPVVIGLAAWYWGTGLAIFSSGALPRWWGWVSVALGILAVLGPLGFIAFLASIPWVFVTAILLMRGGGETLEPAVGTAPGAAP